MTKKYKLIGILTLLLSINSFGQTYNKQNTFLDAIELKEIFNKNKFNRYGDNSELVFKYYDILEKYKIDSNNIESNPFLSDFKMSVEIVSALSLDSKCKPNEATYDSKKIEPNILKSANWQALSINGLANFMAGRFKQEVLHVSIDQIFKQIKTKENAVLVKSIFPKTFKQIGDLYGSGSSSYYTADLLLLRQTAQIDIEQLPKNLIKNSETIFPKLKNEPKINDMLALGNNIVEYSQKGQSLDRLLSILANETYSTDSTVFKILNVLDLISQALLNKEGSKDIWVNPINILPTTDSSLENLEIRYFYGLLYQQLIELPEFKDYLENQDSNNIVLIANKIQDLIRFVNKLNNTYNYLKSKEFNLKSPEDIVTYIKDINQTIIFFTTTLNNIPEINRLYSINETILDVSSRYITIVDAMMKKDYQKVIPLLLIEFGEYMVDNNGKSARTIAFVSQLATIESADDMEALLNSYALPIGSSSVKRHSSFNISLNGYVGLTGGWETAYGSQKNQTKGNIGLSAPIGISATFCKGYLTPFVSFIDLGSIVNQRLNNDTTSYSNLRFEHFFTPGVGLFLNCPKLPITAGFHFNYIPNLRTIKYESGNATISETNRSVTRLNFSVLVDIPFFTIYNREKTKQ